MTDNQIKQEDLLTPFRYPGGKSFLFELLKNRILSQAGQITEYAEAYAGGAGAAIKLLADGCIEKIRINDADQRIFSAWAAILDENERFLERLEFCPLTIDEWHRASDIVNNPKVAKDSFEVGFSTFFLNRTNRSGIIIGAGPIGGYEQKGGWKLDARFYRNTLYKRVKWLGEQRDAIRLSNKDGLSFLRLSSKRQWSAKTLFFIDPPYVGAGRRLYLDLMTENKHRALGAFLQNGVLKNWLVTYDQCPLINEIYDKSVRQPIEVLYSLQKKRKINELMIAPTTT